MKYKVVTSSPAWYKGVTGKVYAIHDESDRVRGIPYYDVEETANSVCEALNNGDKLTAELRYKHNHISKTAEIITVFESAEDVLYYHVQDQLPATVSMSSDSAEHRRQALSEAGFSEPVVAWMPAK